MDIFDKENIVLGYYPNNSWHNRLVLLVPEFGSRVNKAVSILSHVDIKEIRLNGFGI
jgi:hypothetical protein